LYGDRFLQENPWIIIRSVNPRLTDGYADIILYFFLSVRASVQIFCESYVYEFSLLLQSSIIAQASYCSNLTSVARVAIRRMTLLAGWLTKEPLSRKTLGVVHRHNYSIFLFCHEVTSIASLYSSIRNSLTKLRLKWLGCSLTMLPSSSIFNLKYIWEELNPYFPW
jgi:hypothetical protein